MIKYPSSLQNLIECFKKLPGVGERTAERYALSFLSLDEDSINIFTQSMKDVNVKIRRCNKCNNYSEDELCEVCKDKSRDQKTICVVEEPKSIISFERAGAFQGVYHVLDGLISPSDGINPDDINLSSLVKRIENDQIEEVIIAVRPCAEGEITAMYIAKKLEPYQVKVTKIAYGIPLGADMGYMDPLTLEISLENRQKLS